MTMNPDAPERLIEAQQNTIQALQEDLRRTHSELLQLTLELEDRVAERTAELQTANGKLREEIVVRRRVEETLKAQSQELTRSNEELQQFAYVASHDLQEPLRMVPSYVQLLARRYKRKLDADADDFIRGGAFGPADCEEILRRTLGDLRLALEEAGAVVTHDPLPTLTADATQLGQVFQNLIANAIKFQSGGTPHVHISAEKKEDEWVFSVRDNGVGIDPGHIDRISEIFQRLHSRDEYPGVGLGLAICRRIVDRHGGRIWAASEPGKGSTFFSRFLFATSETPKVNPVFAHKRKG